MKIVVGYDFSISSDAALGWLREWQNIGPCDIAVVHVGWPPGDFERLGLRGPMSLTENHPEVERVLERDLRERVAAILGEQQGISFRISPGWGRSDIPLVQLAQEEKADLLVVGSHRRHGFERILLGSVSRGVLHHAPMSVAVVPSIENRREALNCIPDVKRVIVPTDFSAFGNAAIPHAYAAARRGGCVKLIHVIPPWKSPGPLVPHYQSKRLTQKQHKQFAAGALKSLHSLIPMEAGLRGIETEVEVVEHADVGKGIRETAERFGANLICIGSHGRSGLLKAVLGSVAQAVMEQTQRPVLVVRSPKQ